MSTLLEKLRQDHRNLERLLMIVEGQMQGFRAGRTLNLEVMVEVLAYMETYADQIHHPAENLVFEALIRQVGRPTREVSRLLEDHQSLGGLTRRFRLALEGILQGQVIPREAVEQVGEEFIRTNRQHLLMEEREVFPMAEDALTGEDWRLLESRVPSSNDPLFGRCDPLHFQTLCQQLALDNRAASR
ncbi:Cation-binding protein [Gammaproteobacteria bacterium]